MGIVERVAQRFLLAGGSRVLYHIGRRPPEPKPKRGGWYDRGQPGENWERPWLEESVRAGIFLTTNPVAVAENHGVWGHVYAYQVPEWVIKEAKGLHRYGSATEILIPAHLWENVKFKGKSMDKTEFAKFIQYIQTQGRSALWDFQNAYQQWIRQTTKPKAQKTWDELSRL